MTRKFDSTWAAGVRAICDPVFEAADVGFVVQVARDPWSGLTQSILWEADPIRYAARYPDSGIEASYGDQWPPPCIDYWLYVDTSASRGTTSTERGKAPDAAVELTGDAGEDGRAVAEVMARILGVAVPSSPVAPDDPGE